MRDIATASPYAAAATAATDVAVRAAAVANATFSIVSLSLSLCLSLFHSLGSNLNSEDLPTRLIPSHFQLISYYFGSN